MNYLEYTIEFAITNETEKKTNEVIDMIKEGRCAFNIVKIVDEKMDESNEEDGKKKRTFILTSYTNISQLLFKLFQGIDARYLCYIKSPVAM
jgi:hypothetical protein